MIKHHFLHASLVGCEVGDKKALTKNNILSSPVELFIKYHKGAGEKQILELRALRTEYNDLEDSQITARNECKRLSRQIGTAKRGGAPVHKLIQAMQTHSAALKDIESQLNVLSEKNLAFFEQIKQPAPKNDNMLLTPGRYPELTRCIDLDHIIIEPSSNDPAAWNQYVGSHPASSIYHLYEWRSLIRDVFSHDSHYILARNETRDIVGVLPLIRLKSRLFGDFMVSMPYFNYGSCIADTPEVELKLIHEANKLAKKLGVSHIEYRDTINRENLSVATEKVAMILDLPKKTDDLWNGFTAKLRAQIRRPLRENVQTVCGNEECLNDFYTVFSRNMRDLGTPVYGKYFFRKILQCFPEQSKILVVYFEQRPVAAGFLMGYKDTLEIPWASTIRDVNHLSINMLLYWEVLKFAINNNYYFFDFGRSSRDSGTFRFKQQWGAKPMQLYWHYWLADNTELPRLNPNNPKYALAISVWKRLPITVTKWLGPRIVKNLP